MNNVYNFKDCKVPKGIRMLDSDLNTIHNLNEFEKCRHIEITDIEVAVDLNKSYNSFKTGNIFMPNIPTNIGRYTLCTIEGITSISCYWKYNPCFL